jgi:ABC-type transport system involved in cytochrome bd biosynthesis fused ATPase/permease subunit
MVSIDVLALILGVIYGYMSPGKEDKMKILKNGLKWGLIIGIVLGVLNLLVGGGLLVSGAGIIGTVIAVVYLTIFFIIGAFIGDFLEGLLKK